MRRYMFYKVTDAPSKAEQLVRPFHLRAADELERTRRMLYGEGGTFGTDDLNIVDNPYCRNDPGYPYSSPHYVSACADMGENFRPFDEAFRENCAAAGLQVELCAEALWDFERMKWTILEVGTD